MKERARERERRPFIPILYHFCSFFSFAYFSNFKFTSHKKKHENRLERESVVERRFFKLQS